MLPQSKEALNDCYALGIFLINSCFLFFSSAFSLMPGIGGLMYFVVALIYRSITGAKVID